MSKSAAKSAAQKNDGSLLQIVVAALLSREYAVRDLRKSESEAVDDARSTRILSGQSVGSWSELAGIMVPFQQSSRPRRRPREQVDVLKTFVRMQCQQLRDKPSIADLRRLFDMMAQWKSNDWDLDPPFPPGVTQLKFENWTEWLKKAREVLEHDRDLLAIRTALADYSELELSRADADAAKRPLRRTMRAFPVDDPRLGLREISVDAPLTLSGVDLWTKEWLTLHTPQGIFVARPESIVNSIVRHIESLLTVRRNEAPSEPAVPSGAKEPPEPAPPPGPEPLSQAEEKVPRTSDALNVGRSFPEAIGRVTRTFGVTKKELTEKTTLKPRIKPREWTPADIHAVAKYLHERAGAAATAHSIRACLEAQLAFESRWDPLAECTEAIESIRAVFAGRGAFDSLESLRGNLSLARDAMDVAFAAGGARARDGEVSRWLARLYPESASSPPLEGMSGEAFVPLVQHMLATAAPPSPQRDSILYAMLAGCGRPLPITAAAPDGACMGDDGVRHMLHRRNRRPPPVKGRGPHSTRASGIATDLRNFHDWITSELRGYQDAAVPSYRRFRYLLAPGRQYAVKDGLEDLLDHSGAQNSELLMIASTDASTPRIPISKRALQGGLENRLRRYIEKFEF